ncbi:hypothetical protein LGQ02_03260 [Bacillus shivajii]|uniref:hypothetical protein n=1 Tax=Bacillus shivajii TaxID=1983719 RepID=UPI001CF9B6FF|nr:hypothetical protein [Bacillus shivajii]UCZ53819.1 hypothetical protein LGQ02_03260 [Bacillus shivajii]
MKKLTTVQFEQAAHYVMTYGREVDQRLFEFHFLDGSNDDVLNALVAYQNDDGGLGHSIEPDIRSPHSSPIATSIGMQFVREVNAPWKHPIVKSMMSYFTNVYEKYGYWPLKLSHMNDYPRADWWSYSQDTKTFEANPGAEIVGYYHIYPQCMTRNLLPSLHDHVFQYIENVNKPLEFHELLCYVRLVNGMPDPGKAMIIDILREQAKDIITYDTAKWSNYCAKPLWSAPTPNSPLANVLRDAINKNLDYEIENQTSDGSWVPFWEWGQYREVWEEKAKPEWKSWLTVQTLKALHAYERIEN